MRIARTLIVSLLLGSAVATKADAQTLTRGPLIQNPAALTTTMTILWWTDVVGDSTVEYGTTPSLGSSVNVAQAASCEIGSAGTCHAVPLTGLQSGTRYYYRLLTNGVQVLATTYFQTFKTPSDTSELFFTVVGDWGAGTSAQASVGNNQNASDPPLLMTVGDNAYQNGTQSDWDNNVFISQYENQILRRAVFMPILGNHDLNNVGASNWASSVEIKMHQMPRNAPAGQEERFFSFDDGNAHFTILDANTIDGTQTSWLANDLATTTRKWKFVFFHQTSYSCANGIASIGSNHTVRDTWGPIFEQYQVDVVFMGHDHSYERSHLVDDYVVGGAHGSDGLGTVYVMTGGGGAALDGAAQVDSGGPYGQGFTHPKEYCPWLSTQCPNGVNGQYCSFSRYQHMDVRISNDSALTVKSVADDGSTLDQFVIAKGTVCGNGLIEVGEQCDQGAANGTSGSCCTSGCQFVSVGTSCRTAAGVCDVVETCTGASGACPANGFASASTVCRPSAGGCDPAETCTGSSAACPADTIFGNGAVCRPAAGVCDLPESCDGVSTACPSDAKWTGVCRPAVDVCDAPESCTGSSDNCPPNALAPAGTPCRGVAGVCDVAETCTGTNTACPADGFDSSTVMCRPANGVCDVAEFCTGTGPNCPGDGFEASTTVCRPSTAACDAAETCTGVGPNCPADGVAPSSTVCRPASGPCDAAEQCTGTSTVCPSDGVLPSATICRPALGVCDVAETCDGVAKACPADGVAPSTTPCRPPADVCDVGENCTGTSAACPANTFKSSSTVCRPAVGQCDLAENCTGNSAACPADAFASSTTVCRASTAPCDSEERCTGTSSACPVDVVAPSSTVCRAAAGVCDVAEHCDGVTTACPANTFAPSTTVCRASAGVCDVAETCTGSSANCPADVLVPGGTTCRPSGGVCDVAETCNGTSPACPSDTVAGTNVVCRPAVGVCDAAETCNGGVNCPADGYLSASVVCRPSVGACDVPESCTGSSTSCPADTGQPDADGDGVCDLDDDCVSVPNSGQEDADGDGLGDACDPCTNAVPVHAVKPKLTLLKLAPPAGDDRFKFQGTMTVPSAAIDPASSGVRVIVTDASGTTVLDVTIPAGFDGSTGVGWRANGSGTSFLYKNSGKATPLIGGITKITVKRGKTAGEFRFSVLAKNGSYVLPTTLPVTGTFILSPPYASSNQCGDAVFPGAGSPSCAYVPPAGTVKCK